jgi:hypothetical protein
VGGLNDYLTPLFHPIIENSRQEYMKFSLRENKEKYRQQKISPDFQQAPQKDSRNCNFCRIIRGE